MAVSEPLRLAVFDCDGTLVDSQHSILASVHAACDAHDLARPEANSVKRIVGLPLKVGIARLWPDEDAEVHAVIAGFYRDHFNKLRAAGAVNEPLFPGVIEGLAAFENDGWLLGVATGKSHKGLLGSLGEHGLEDRFVTLQTADSAEGKPSPHMLLRAMAETGVEAEATVMIGDTTFDMEMAQNAGTLAVGVAWGYHETEELLEAGAQVVATAFHELFASARDLVARR
jgi:phosphoglycolate phosphatase